MTRLKRKRECDKINCERKVGFKMQLEGVKLEMKKKRS